MYDTMHTPLSNTDYKPFTYEESLAKAEEVLAVLGEGLPFSCETCLLANGGLILHVNQGKRSGAYSG